MSPPAENSVAKQWIPSHLATFLTSAPGIPVREFEKYSQYGGGLIRGNDPVMEICFCGGSPRLTLVSATESEKTLHRHADTQVEPFLLHVHLLIKCRIAERVEDKPNPTAPFPFRQMLRKIL